MWLEQIFYVKPGLKVALGTILAPLGLLYTAEAIFKATQLPSKEKILRIYERIKKEDLLVEENFLDLKSKIETQEKNYSQAKFRDKVIELRGEKCLFCGHDHVEACHIAEAQFGGSNEILNGLSLCPTHHQIFDRQEILIDPYSLDIIAVEKSCVQALGCVRWDLKHLKPKIPDIYLKYRFICDYLQIAEKLAVETDLSLIKILPRN